MKHKTFSVTDAQRELICFIDKFILINLLALSTYALFALAFKQIIYAINPFIVVTCIFYSTFAFVALSNLVIPLIRSKA